MYMDSNQLYIDKVTNLANSGINETKSASLTASPSSKDKTTTFSFTSPSIGQSAGIYNGRIALSIPLETYSYTATFKSYFSLGGTYRPTGEFANSASNTSLTNIQLVSSSFMSQYGSQIFSGTRDFRYYVRIA